MAKKSKTKYCFECLIGGETLVENADMSLEEGTQRFQREELFKHNALGNCKKKLAVTLKTSSVPNQVSGDEYIPIDHILDASKKRVRLLNPYVLRLRRTLPFQTYKLRRIDTVTGIIIQSFDKKRMAINQNKYEHNLSRRSNNNKVWSTRIDKLSAFTFDNHDQQNFLIRTRNLKQPFRASSTSKTSMKNMDSHDKTYICNNSITEKRNDAKRHCKYYEGVHFSQNFGKNLIHDEWNQSEENKEDIFKKPVYNKNFSKELDENPNDKPCDVKMHKRFNKNTYKQEVNENDSKVLDGNDKDAFLFAIYPSSSPVYRIDSHPSINSKEINSKKHFNKNMSSVIMANGNITNEEQELVLYEIGEPDLWYTAHVQLFEKLSSPEGNILWNDLTKHATASVGPKHPEWSAKDVNIHYKPIELLARDDFLLPLQNLCLIVPLKFAIFGDFIIVPTEDIITLSDHKKINKRNKKSFDYNTASYLDSGQLHRRVAVRMARALVGGNFNNLKIISRGFDCFLRLPHTKPYQTQIDVEVKADDNALILVGMHGRLTTIVSDSTRLPRSVFSVQATNMGLTGARFRVLIRECTPKFIDASVKRREKEGTVSRPVVFPPKHTKSFRLYLPLTISMDNANCDVVLVNENEEAVAVRNVKIKKGDRCFCVWHCDCVCLSEDPKLLCRRLSEAQLLAAGLPTQEKSRHIRSVCYPDLITVDMFVTVVGVLLALLLLGTIKATLGLLLRCVGSWGLHLLMQAPRKLEQYYESSLRSRPVVYDREGWPVHPDTKQRSVRLISKPMEFILNMIFFITLPCILICDVIKKLLSRCNTTERKLYGTYRKSETKKCFSSRDTQCIAPRHRQCRGDLHQWMSPQAEELSTGIWQEGLIPQIKNSSDCLRPLLHEKKCCSKTTDHSLGLDSEQDDTEYILMQIQKSKESMAKSQRIMETSPNEKITAFRNKE